MRPVLELLKVLATRGFFSFLGGIILVALVARRLIWVASQNLGHVRDGWETGCLLVVTGVALGFVATATYSGLEIGVSWIACTLKATWARRVVSPPRYEVVVEDQSPQNVWEQVMSEQTAKALADQGYQLTELDRPDFQVLARSAVRQVCANPAVIEQGLCSPAYQAYRQEPDGKGPISRWVADRQADISRKRRPFWLVVLFVRYVLFFGAILRDYSPYRKKPPFTFEVFAREVKRSPGSWALLASQLPTLPVVGRTEPCALPIPEAPTGQAGAEPGGQVVEPAEKLEPAGVLEPPSAGLEVTQPEQGPWEAAMEDSPAWEDPAVLLSELSSHVETGDYGPELAARLEALELCIAQAQAEFTEEVEEGSGDLGSLRPAFVEGGRRYMEAGMSAPEQLRRQCIRLRALELLDESEGVAA